MAYSQYNEPIRPQGNYRSTGEQNRAEAKLGLPQTVNTPILPMIVTETTQNPDILSVKVQDLATSETTNSGSGGSIRIDTRTTPAGIKTSTSSYSAAPTNVISSVNQQAKISPVIPTNLPTINAGNYPKQETVQNFIAPAHLYTVQDFNKDLINFFKKAENELLFPDPANRAVKDYLLQKGEEVTNLALKNSNIAPEELALVRAGQTAIEEKAAFDLKYPNGEPPKGSEVKFNNDVEKVNNAIDLYNAIQEKTDIETQSLPYLGQVIKRFGTNVEKLPITIAKTVTSPLSSTTEFLQSIPETLEKASLGDPAAIADIGTLILFERGARGIGELGKGSLDRVSKTGKVNLERAGTIKPKEIDSVSVLSSPSQVDKLVQTVHNNFGADIQKGISSTTSTDAYTIRLKDGRVFDVIQIGKVSSENGVAGSSRGTVQTYALERKGTGKLFGQSVQEINKGVAQTYTNAYVLDSAKKIGRNVEILEQSKTLGSNNSFLKNETATQAIARQYAERQLTKQEALAVKELESKFNIGLDIGLEELKQLINIEKRMNGEKIFTDQEFKQATKGIETISQVKSFLKNLKVTDQIGNLVNKAELRVRNGKIVITGTKEIGSTQGGLTNRRASVAQSKSLGRALSKPEKVITEKVRVSTAKKLGISKYQLQGNIKNINPKGEIAKTKLTSPKSLVSKGISESQLLKNINKSNRPRPLVSTVVKALSRPERVSRPRARLTNKPSEFSDLTSLPLIVQVGGRERSEFTAQGRYETTNETSNILPNKKEFATISTPIVNTIPKDNSSLGTSSKPLASSKSGNALNPQFKDLTTPTSTTKPRTEIINRFKLETNQQQKQEFKQGQVQKQEFKQLQETNLGQKNRPRIEENIRPKPREPIRIIRPNPQNDKFSKNKSNKPFGKVSSGFAPLVRVKGKFERIGNISYKTREEALGAGQSKVFKDLTRSVAIERTRGEKTISSTAARAEFNKLSSGFRPSKQFGSSVQVQRNALATSREVRLIQEAKIKAQREQFKTRGARKLMDIR